MTPEQQARSLSPLADALRAEIERLGREEYEATERFYCTSLADYHATREAMMNAEDARSIARTALGWHVSHGDSLIGELRRRAVYSGVCEGAKAILLAVVARLTALFPPAPAQQET